MGPHDPCHVANHFIQEAIAQGDPITPMKTQKLLFLAHGWMLALHGRPLLDTYFEAWRYGPVMPVVYHRLSYYGGQGITAPILAHHKDFDEEELDTLQQITDVYGPFDQLTLGRMTSIRNGPWHRTWSKRRPMSAIPDESIRKYFSNMDNFLTDHSDDIAAHMQADDQPQPAGVAQRQSTGFVNLRRGFESLRRLCPWR